MSYFYVFLQSNLLELPVYLAALAAFGYGRGAIERAAFATAMNSLTHPIVFFVIMSLKASFLTCILTAEGFAIGAECAMLVLVAGLPLGRALVVSLAANLVSWQIGAMLTFALFGP